MLLTAAGSSTEPYQERISVSERYVTLSGVVGADEGSYTVRNNKGVIQKKVCLNVKGENTNTDRFFLLDFQSKVFNQNVIAVDLMLLRLAVMAF